MDALGTDVLIVGGGPVGLALATELGTRGVHALLVERRDGSVGIPKMNLVNVRTMEHCRRWGVAAQVREAGLPSGYPHDIVFVTTLAGHELGRLPRAAKDARAPAPTSPETWQQCSQLWFDPILRERVARCASVELRYRTELLEFSQDAAGVSARLRELDSGRERACQARYLVGCDGAESLVRAQLGIEQRGNGVLSRSVNGYFESDHFLSCHSKGPAVRYFFANAAGLWSNIVAIDGVRLWRFAVTRVAEGEATTAAELDALLAAAVGGGFRYRWSAILPWVRRELVAERYGHGRVFLAGDAAHQLSPTGGFGMNTGIGDAVDLGWKLAAVLRGWGGAGLLESYDAERRPIGERNLAEATGNFRLWTAPLDERVLAAPECEQARRELGARLVESLRREFETDGIQLGYRYEGSAVCVPDGTPNPPDDPMRYEPAARPGARAPHAWLADGRSTLDLFGAGFVLLCFRRGIALEAISHAFARREVPLEIVQVDDACAARLYERALVLVRPDGHVAWRGDSPPDGLALADRVRGASVH